MYFSLGFYPPLDEETAGAIDAIRRKYDPTYGAVTPHVTVIFPVPDSVGEAALISHIETVLREWRPFEIRFSGFCKSRDHWLFLTLKEGRSEVKEIYKSLHTGMLAEYRRDDVEFIPHIGLGLFVKTGSNYDWDNPQDMDFDQMRYEEALREARALSLQSIYRVEELRLTKVPDEIIDWATGKRVDIPEGSRVSEVRAFLLGADCESS